jgi:hypothetical protein
MSAHTTASVTPAWRRAAAVLSRVLAAIFAGYGFAAGCVALVSVALPQLVGVPRSEAVLLASMLGFLVYLVVLLWAGAARRLWRVWAVLAGGAALGFGLAQVLALMLDG